LHGGQQIFEIALHVHKGDLTLVKRVDLALKGRTRGGPREDRKKERRKGVEKDRRI